MVRFKMALATYYEETGKASLIQTLRDDPETFWHLVSRALTKREALGLSDNPSDRDLDRIVERVVAGIRMGTPHEGKPTRGRMH
jgi:hypothetical protein